LFAFSRLRESYSHMQHHNLSANARFEIYTRQVGVTD